MAYKDRWRVKCKDCKHEFTTGITVSRPTCSKCGKSNVKWIGKV